MRRARFKVALIDPSLFTPPYDRALMEGLAAAGDETRLYTKRLGAEDSFAADAGTVQHFYRSLTGSLARLPPGVLRGLKGGSHVADMGLLSGALRDWRPDIIHFQWAPLPVIDRMFLPRLRRVAPLVLTVHDSNPFNGNPTNLVQRLGAFAILEDFDALIVHTAQARDRLLARGVAPGKITTIPHGLLHDGMGAVATAESGPAPSGPFVDILMFGKVKPYKGVDVLIEAVALLPPELRAKCRIRVVGKPYMDTKPLLDLASSRGVADRFQFEFRFVDDEEIARLFAAASVVVFPYREIDASGVLMAALAAERAIVASRIGGFAELLQDEREALLVPPDDPRALAAALARVVGQGEIRANLAAGVSALRRAMPSWAEIGRATHALYETLLDAPHREPVAVPLSTQVGTRIGAIDRDASRLER